MKLNEKLGVPYNITKMASDIKNKIFESIDSKIPNIISKDLFKNNEYFINIGKFDIEINDLKINNLQFYVKLVYVDTIYNIDVAKNIGASYNKEIEYVNNGNYIKIDTNINKDKEIYISLNIAITQYNNIKSYIIREVKSVESSLIAHELMHLYDGYKSKKSSIKKRSEYNAFQQVKFPGILSDFLYLLYFTSVIENVVRPSEIYTDLIDNNITRKKFKSFIQENEILKKIKNAKDFSLEELRNNIDKDMMLSTYLDVLVKDSDYIRLDKNNISSDILNILFINLTNAKLNSSKRLYMDYLSKNRDFFQDVVSVFFGKSDKVRKKEELVDIEFEKIINSYKKFKHDPIKYFEKLEKYLNYNGDKMYRKIYKLYGMLNENKYIIEWELFEKSKFNKK